MIVRYTTLKHVLEERDYLRGQVERLEAARAETLALYSNLVQQMHQMVRDGYRPAPAEAPPPPLFDLPAPVLEAIAARAQDRDMRRDMEQWARTRLDAGDEEGAVATRIWRGEEGL